MDKQRMIDRLLALPAEIAAAEDAVLEANGRVLTAKEALQAAEDALTLTPDGPINGKNAEVRAAQMRQYTEEERAELAEAEIEQKNAVARLGRARDEFRALRAVADLLKGAA